ncbi:MAG TPA: hypothetical protein VN783_11575 [Thermoanaerobaculia bacterium]|nr:hypothetical protein [Thermoanaerobaculia bacterium]
MPDDLFSTSDEHLYFRAIEEMFVRVRGASILLGPRDYEIARRWHERKIPLDLIERVLTEVLWKRRERGAKDKVSSLRYGARAVEAAWEEIQELTALGETLPAPALDVPVRLAALAGALERALPEAAALASRMRALAGAAESVERELARLDEELLATAEGALPGDEAAALVSEVERSMAALAKRLPAEEIERARERLRRQAVRRRLSLPLLSLFSPDAEPPDESPEERT